MATMRDIKRRKSSIESTEQITKAMKLVATVKLQKSRTKAENSRLYFNLMYQTIQEMLKKSTISARRSLIITAAGVSIIMPCSGILYCTSCFFSSSSTSATIA
jgi:F0F1-type ATP synthase gamma subunit